MKLDESFIEYAVTMVILGGLIVIFTVLDWYVRTH